jgi:hypothetical protein
LFPKPAAPVSGRERDAPPKRRIRRHVEQIVHNLPKALRRDSLQGATGDSAATSLPRHGHTPAPTGSATATIIWTLPLSKSTMQNGTALRDLAYPISERATRVLCSRERGIVRSQRGLGPIPGTLVDRKLNVGPEVVRL